MTQIIGSLPRPRKTREQLDDVGPIAVVRFTDEETQFEVYELRCRECDFSKRITDPPDTYWSAADDHIREHLAQGGIGTGMAPPEEGA
jgi:hypothetical protein